MEIKKILTLLPLFIIGLCFQVNAQFKGGQADGYVKDCFVQSFTNIYAGGQGQGYKKDCYSQTTTNIYAGGSADGYDKSCYTQTSTNIYAGGSADGYDKNCYAQPNPLKPVVQFIASDSTICVGACISFTDLSLYTPTSWVWTFYGASTTTSTAQNPSNICYNTPGSYKVRLVATNVLGFDSLVKVAYIHVVANPTVTVTPTTQTICLGSGGNIYLSSSSATMDYAWSPSTGLNTNVGDTVIASPTTNQTYNITATDNVYGCVVLKSAQVAVTGIPTITANAVNSTICEGAATNLVANGGLTYSWSPSIGLNQTSGSVVSASPTSTQTYTVTGANGSGCTSTAQVTVNVNPAPILSVTNSNPVFCFGGNSTLLASGANTYTWNPSLGLNTATGASVIATPAITTNYAVTGVGANGCSSTSNTLVTVNQLPTVNISSNTTVVCLGSYITLTASGANTYAWSPAGTLNNSTGTSVNAFPIVNTTYNVIGTDANNCQNTASRSLTMGTIPTVVITSSGNTVCLGQNVTLQASGANAYTWNPNIGASGANVSITPAGNVNYTVTGYNSGAGCTATATANIVVNSNPTAASISVVGGTTILCPGGTITLNANGAQNGATYQWQLNNVDVFGATSSSLGATVAGTYNVIVGNANNCTANSSNTVTLQGASAAAATITANGPITFCTGGSVLLTATTGSGLTYQWYNNGNILNGETNQTYLANIAGSYTVAVTLNAQCTTTSNATQVTINPYPTAAITPDGPTTFCGNSSVNLFANTGTNLSYAWSYNGGNLFNGAASINVNAAGTYTLYVTNGFNCTSNASEVVSHLPTPSAIATPASTTTLCDGQSVVINANTGAGLSYQWYSGLFTISNETNASYTASTNGNFSVVVTNSNGCTNTSNTVGVSIIANPSANISTFNPITFCAGGSALLNANTGTGLTHQWQLNGGDINGATSSSYSAATSGLYTCKVILNGSCNAISNGINITVNPLPIAAITPSGTVDICPGSLATLSANTGAGLSYTWYYNGNNQFVNSATYSAGAAGSYAVVVTNANNCPNSSNTVTLNLLPAPNPTITAQGNTTICPGGSVTLQANTGAGISHQWNLNGSPITNATTSSYVASATGNYTVTETGSNTCSATSANTNVTVLTGPAASIIPQTSTTFCDGGSVILAANAGTGLTYQWYFNGNTINGEVNQTYGATASGNYSVQVTLNNNCSSTSQVTNVVVNPNPVAVITPSGNTTFCAGNSIDLVANSGNYNYTWVVNGFNTFTNVQTIGASVNGTYAMSLQDIATGCGSGTSIVITVNPLPIAEITPLSNTNICSNGQVILQATNAAGYGFQWKLNGSNIANAIGQNYIATLAGNYTVEVTNSNNCTATSALVNVNVSAAPAAVITANGTTTFCAGGNVPISANTVVGLTHQWLLNNVAIVGETLSYIYPSIGGNYSCTVTLNGGCSETSNVIAVTVNPAPTASVSYNGNTTFCSGNSLLLSANTGAGLTYEWYVNGSYTGITSATYNATGTGNYSVKVINSNSCYAYSAGVSITVNPAPNVPVSASGNTNICPGNTVTLSVPAINNDAYQWAVNGNNIPFATNIDLLIDAQGYYTVTGTNAFGCTATSTPTFVYVNGGSNAPIYATGAISFCPGGSVDLHTVHGQGLTYQWYYNGDPILNANDSIYTASQTGSFNVQVILDLNCTSVSGFINVDASGGTFAAVMSDLSPINCTGDSIQLYTNTGLGYTYQWYLDGTPITDADSSLHLAITYGLYSVSVDNGNGCSSTSNPVQVVLNNAPSNVVAFSGPTTYCAGGGVWAILENRPNSNYTWYYRGFMGNYFPILNFNNDSLYLTGSNSYYAVINNGSCTVTTYGFSTQENPNPIVSVTASSNTNICPGQTVNFTAHGHIAPPFTYKWYNNGTLIVTALDSIYGASTAGNYSCVLTNAFGCSVAALPRNVYVNDGSSAQATIINGNDTLCQGFGTTMIATYGEGLTHQWYYNGDPIIGATDSVYTATATGFYNCQVILDQNCTSVSNLIEITVNPLPVATITNNQGITNTIVICVGTTVEITVPFNANNSYQWMLNGSPITSATANVYSASGAGTYTVLVTNTVTGCSVVSVGTVATVQSCGVVPPTQVSSNDCGGTFVRTSSIFCNNVAGATKYEWEFSNANGVYATKITYYRTVPLHGVNPILNWGTTWNVRVRAYIGNDVGQYSVQCTVTIIPDPAIFGVPQTQLRAPDCGKLNYTYGPTNNRIIADYIYGALNYEFEFSNPTTGAVVATKIQPLNTLYLNLVTPALPVPAQYNVRVRAQRGTTWGIYGNTCLIGIVSFARESMLPDDAFTYDEAGNINGEKETTFSLNAMPNPFNDQISLYINSSINENVEVKIFDITGQLIELVTIGANEKLQVGANYSNGIYMINAIGKISNKQVNFKSVKNQ